MLFFLSVVSILPLTSSQVFSLIQPFFFLAFVCFLFFPSLCLQCLCFHFVFPDLPVLLSTAIITVSFLSLWFICVRFVFLFQSDAALLLDSRSANANAEWNDKCVCSQCSCHLVYSGPLLKGMRPHWGLIRFQGDCRRPLKGAIYGAVWINNIITTLTSYLLLLSGCWKPRLCSNGGPPVIGLVESSLAAAVTFNQTIIYYSESPAPAHAHTHPEVQKWFSAWCAKVMEILNSWQPTSAVTIAACRIPSAAGSASSPALACAIVYRPASHLRGGCFWRGITLSPRLDIRRFTHSGRRDKTLLAAISLL